MSQQNPTGYPYPEASPGQAPGNQGYPQGYPAPGQGYPATGQGYPPQAQGYPPQAQGYPSQGQGYPSQGQGYPSTGSGYPGQTPGYPQNVPQAASGYPHPQQNFPAQGHLPVPPRTNTCVSQVVLTLKCRNLQDRDGISKSDSMIAVFLKIGNNWVEKGRTETIKNCLNPEFSRKIQLDYLFEETQNVRFDVYDIDNTSHTLKDDDFLGRMECTLGQVVSSSPFSKPLLTTRGTKIKNSTITVYAEEVDAASSEVLTLHFKGKQLDNKDFLGKSDPFLEISKIGKDGAWQMVHRTPVIKNNLNPVWQPFEIKQQLLGGSNIESQILIVCHDYDGDGSHDLIGQCTLTLAQLLEAQHHEMSWPLVNQKKQKEKGKSYKNSGNLILSSCKVSKSYTFLDYVFGGTQINFVVAVDFTASNGDPRQPNSLHFVNPSYPNEYISAISAVGNIIKDYDSDKLFPALGFGAKIPPHMQVSHEFALNFNIQNPFCSGVEGLIAAYKNCLGQVQLYGPTNFTPVINHVMRFAQEAHQKPTPDTYFVLLMITDGVVTDMNDTCQAVVSASQLPMSIIIVGVGQADFTQMNFLDGDGGQLRSPGGQVAVRDIVQFVPFNKFRQYDPSVLAREVLAEIPQQISQYYRMRNIPPNPPRHTVQECT